jgi:ribose transport system permease protein
MNAPFLHSQSDVLRGSQRTFSRREAVIRSLLDHGLLVALIIEIGIFSLAAPTIFFSRENFFTILRLSAATGITVAFYSMALIAGQIDLSTAQVGGLSAVVFAWMFGIAQWPLEIAVILAVLFSVWVGLANSWLVTRVGLPSLIATLAMGTLCFGVTIAIVQANTTTGLIRLTRPPLRSVVSAEVFGIPVVVILMFIVYFAVYILLNHTRLGAHLYALGGNPQAARLNGIQSTRLIRLVLVGTAISASVAAIITAGRNLSAGSVTQVGTAGTLLGGPLIAAVFGGVGLAGGAGKVERTLIGVLFLSVLSVGMSILNATPFIRIMIEGVAFVLAIVLDSIRQQIENR